MLIQSTTMEVVWFEAQSSPRSEVLDLSKLLGSTMGLISHPESPRPHDEAWAILFGARNRMVICITLAKLREIAATLVVKLNI